MLNETTNGTNTSKIDLGEFMKVMDIADIHRKTAENVKEQLSIDEQKVQLKEKMRNTYATMGASVDDSQLDKAIEDYYSTQWEFKEPQRNVSTDLAKLYIHRGTITKKIILPTVAVLTAGYFAVAGIGSLLNANQAGLEKKLEGDVESAYATRKTVENSATLVATSYFAKELPVEEAQKMNNELIVGKNKLNETNNFFQKFCPAGKSEKAISQKNYDDAKAGLPPVKEKINLAAKSIDNAKTYIIEQEQFDATVKSLDSAMLAIKTINPVKPLLSKAETLYVQGKEGAKIRKLDDVRKATKGLTDMVGDCKDFGALAQQALQLYNAADKTAIEPSAKERVGRIKGAIESYIQLADVSNLKKINSELTDINYTLNQEYTIEVINNSAIKTGVWRKSKTCPPKNLDDTDPEGKNFYIIVHAVTPRGEEVTLTKKNATDGKYEDVKIWGEKVPQDVYLRIKKDKMDDNLVNNSNCPGFENRYIAKKVKGYISVTPIMKDNKGNYFGDLDQITKDKDNWRVIKK